MAHNCRSRLGLSIQLMGLASLLAFAGLWSAEAAERTRPPTRVVSFNSCGDQLLLALADRAQITALSAFAADPTVSPLAQQAANLPRVGAFAEAAIALAPDLILVGPMDRAAKRRALLKAEIAVHAVSLVSSIDAALTQVAEIAALLGHPERGDALVDSITRARLRLRALSGGGQRTALLLEWGGYAPGPESMASALLAEAGFQPVPGAPAGYGGFIPLERLVTMDPDLLVVTQAISDVGDQGAMLLAHPALLRRFPPERRVFLPHRLTICGGPSLLAALETLADRLERLSP